MTHDEAFIRAIRESPNDDAPRLIYADWLEEHDQADRAEFIRLQCQIERLAKDDSTKTQLQSRTEELLRSHWDEWVGPLRDIVGPWRDRYGEPWRDQYHPDGLKRFQRGFVNVLGLDAEKFLQNVEQIKRLIPLRELRLWGAGRCAERLAHEPELAGLSVLSFTDYYDTPLSAKDAAELAKSPFLHGLSVLYLGRNSLGDEGVEALARAPWLESVTVLDLSDNGLSDRALRALADSPYLVNLKTLFAQYNFFSEAGIQVVVNSPNLRKLTRRAFGQREYLGPLGQPNPTRSRAVFLLEDGGLR